MVSIIAYLVEANVLGLLTEALTAEVEVVLADETSSVLADAATERRRLLAFRPLLFSHSDIGPAAQAASLQKRQRLTMRILKRSGF